MPRLRSVHLEIAEDEAVSLDDVPDSAGNRLGKAGTHVDERVEFASLAAWVDIGGQLGEQAIVVLATGERAVELLRVYAYEHCAKAGSDEFVRKAGGVPAPEGKKSALAFACEQDLAIPADVLEEEIAKATSSTPSRRADANASIHRCS